MNRILQTALAATLLSGAALAHHDGTQYRAGTIAVSHAYTFENAENAHAMRVYLTIMNEGENADALIDAHVPFADTVHFVAQTLDASGSLLTREVPSVTVDAGQTFTMQPGAVWIELEGVTRTFEHGEHFDLSVTFENAGPIPVEVEVEEADDHHHDDTEQSS